MKGKFYKCHFCENEGVGRLSPDMDLVGIVFCEEHRYHAYGLWFDLMREADNRTPKTKEQ